MPETNVPEVLQMESCGEKNAPLVLFWFPFSGSSVYLYVDQPHYSLNCFRLFLRTDFLQRFT